MTLTRHVWVTPHEEAEHVAADEYDSRRRREKRR
jgi:hypothetical protein